MEITNIHNRFHKLLYNYIFTRISNSDDASDILQEVFIKIATKIDSLGNAEKLQSWIFAITRNAITDHYRKNANGKTSAITDEIIDETKEDVELHTSKGLDQCLKRFILDLPVEYRDIIIDSELKGVPQKDLAGKYGLAYPSVRSRVQRGRGRLKQMLLQCCSIAADSRGNILEVKKKSAGPRCTQCN